MLSLMLRDPVRQGLGKMLLMQVVFVFNVVGLVSMEAFRDSGLSDRVLTVLLWLLTALILLAARHDRRCSEMDLALPIAGRRLWLAHGAALLATGLLLLAAGLPISIGLALILNFSVDLPVRLPMVGFVDLLGLVAGVCLLVACLNARRPTLATVPKTRPALATNLAVLAIIGAALYLPVVWQAVVIPAMLAVAAILVLRSLRRLEPTLLLAIDSEGGGCGEADDDASPTAAASPPAAPRSSLSRRLRVAWMVCRCTWHGFAAPYVVMPITAAFASLVGGSLTPMDGDENVRFTMTIMAAYIMTAGIIALTQRLYLLQPLPVRRSALLAAITVPQLLALIAGYAVGDLIAHRGGSDESVVRYVEFDEGWRLVVPLSFCEIVPDGEVPENGAPDGESHPAWSARFVKGLPVAVSSPYSTPGGSSRGFVAHQIAKALRDVHGADVSAAEIAAEFLDVTRDGAVVPRHPVQSLADRYGLTSRVLQAPVFPVLVLIVIVFWSLALGVFFHLMHAGLDLKARKIRLMWVLGPMLLLHLLQYALDMTRVVNIDLAPALWRRGLSDLSATLPGGDAMIWGLCILGAAICWNRLLGRFRRAEFNTEEDKTGLSLLGG